MWRIQRADSVRVRLKLLQAFRTDCLEAKDTICLTPALQLVQARQLRFVGRDDDLATEVVRDTVLVTVPKERFAASNAQFRLERPGRVVNPGVNDATIMAGLM